MKNVLMASSAIVGAAVLVASPAAAQELKLSAFQQFMASGGDSDADSSDRGFAFSTNTEVHVNGSIMADNGITFGFRVEFEADTGATNNVDENSIFASGSFGKLEFGNNDGAEDTFMVNGSNSGVDYGGVGNPTSNFLSSAFAGSAHTSVDMTDSGDATKITYTTPNFNGFSAGLSYTPDTSDGTDGNAFNGADADGAHDHIGLGLGYEGEFNGVGLELGLVGQFGTFDEEPEDDLWGIGGGVAVAPTHETTAATLCLVDPQRRCHLFHLAGPELALRQIELGTEPQRVLEHGRDQELGLASAVVPAPGSGRCLVRRNGHIRQVGYHETVVAHRQRVDLAIAGDAEDLGATLTGQR
jgi:hypothetical protein